MYHTRYLPELMRKKKKIILIFIIHFNTYTNGTMKTFLFRISLMRRRMRKLHESIYKNHLLYNRRNLVRRDVTYYVYRETRKDEEWLIVDRKEHPEKNHSGTQHQDTNEDVDWFEYYTVLYYT